MVRIEDKEFPWDADGDALYVLDVDTCGSTFDLTPEGRALKKELPEVYDRYLKACMEGREIGQIDFCVVGHGATELTFCFMFVADRFFGKHKDTAEDVALAGQVCIDDLVENLQSELQIPIVSGILFRAHSLFNPMKKYIENEHPKLNWTFLRG